MDGHFSESLLWDTVLLQGSVLGQLLFSMYINDLPGCLQSTLHHIFADDMQLLYSSPKNAFNEDVLRINQDL